MGLIVWVTICVVREAVEEANVKPATLPIEIGSILWSAVWYCLCTLLSRPMLLDVACNHSVSARGAILHMGKKAMYMDESAEYADSWTL